MSEDRNNLSLRADYVRDILPEYFAADYPNLIQFLETYYDALDSDGNIIRFKDSDVTNAIKADNSIITGDSDAVSIIVDYCNNYSNLESSVTLPDYLTPEAIASIEEKDTNPKSE